MWPRIGPIPTYAILYQLGIIAHFLVSRRAAHRLGLRRHGCCHGKPSSLPWAVVFPEGIEGTPTGIGLHPTQVYEIITMGALVLVFRLLRSERWRGTILLWFVGIYGFGRAATDIFRGDADRYIYIGPITLTQLICLAAAIVSIVILLLCHHHHVVGHSAEGQNRHY